MPSDDSILGALVLAFCVTIVATPVMIRVAQWTGTMDYPGGYKRHTQPTPYLGGLAILAAVVLASAATAGVSTPIPIIASGAIAICLLGTIDDRRGVSPVLRLAIQAGVGVAMWAAGAGWNTGLPDAAEMGLTVFWIVLAVNAFNLIDNVDGAASSAAAGSALGVAGIALILDADAWAALIALALLGACLGFLPFNLSRPPRIFLGDGGSNLLGFLVALGAMGALWDESVQAPTATMMLLLGLPLLDTAWVMVSRWRRGVPLLNGGRDHLTHRVLARVGSPARLAAIVATAQIGLSTLAVAAVELNAAVVTAVGALYVVAVVVVIIVAGRRPTARFGPSPRIQNPG